jgi:hypothetical protein
MKADEEEAAGAPSPNDATHEDVPADAEASAAASRSSETKHHTVVTEVPKFRFVSIAKKSAGYKSEYAGSYIEGKSAQELLAARQKELGLLRKSSTGSVKSKSAAAEEVAAKNTPSELNTEERGGDDRGGLRKVGKLNINENKDEYSEEFIADVDGVRRFRKEGDLDGDEDAEKEESDKKDGLGKDSQEKSEAYESEEDDLEAQTAAVPPVTTTTLSLPISRDEKQNVVVNVSLSLATTSTGGAVGAVPVTSPTNGADTPTNKQEDVQPTKKCSTKKVILIALIVLLVVVVVVLGVALGTRSTDGKSGLKDDANSSLNNNQDVANDTNNDGTVTDPTPSESLAKVSSLLSSMFCFCNKKPYLLLTTIKLSGMLQLNLPSTLLLFSMCQPQHQYQQLLSVVTGFYQTKGSNPATKTWKLNNKCLYLVEVQM